MPKTMLIDASHPEETRVAVVQGGKVEDFDFEYASRKPLRGNIYLARVTRVEPSLQAAFIEYGGNRHGFLAFGEIHPDYYQIPVADREVLRKAEALELELAQKLAELNQDDDHDEDFDPDEDTLSRGGETDDDIMAEAAAASTDEQDEGADDDPSADFVPGNEEQDPGDWHAADESLIETVGQKKSSPSEEEEEEEERRGGPEAASGDDTETAAMDAPRDDAAVSEDTADAAAPAAGQAEAPEASEASEVEPHIVDTSAGGDPEADVVAKDEEAEAPAGKAPKKEKTEEERAAEAAAKEISKLRSRYEEAKRERNRLLRAYKIQEVIKRRQIMLVQVVKEERGNKGAALTTYLSLAGRYGVLMPNTARGGGISRKITSQGDRKRLKKAMSELDIPQNMGLIIRTAGAKRTKVEIKRDYDYLSRLWETIRGKTLESVAPTLIYEEASLIKRAIRDLYDKDTEMVCVEGEAGYREAKDFMKMLMPSHARNVQQHKAKQPLFLKHKVEQQLDEMYQPVVTLKSGGYLVIQQTEALVSVDVNSGRSTKERNVEQTALKTNSEAAVEVARQCRLRDLAGLIVIDFIDMEENRNNRTVEKKLKEAMKNDRARTQIGSISNFGLLELSRQRRRSGIVDGTTQACPVCEGAGHVRSHEMAALRILRAAEGIAATGKHGLVTVKTSTEVALYMLNTKRAWLERMEATYGVKTNILVDTSRYADQYDVQGSGSPNEAVTLKETIGDEGPLSDFEAPELPGGDAKPSEAKTSEEAANDEGEDDDKPKRKRRRRRRRSSGESAQNNGSGASSEGQDQDDGDSDDDASEADGSDGAEKSGEADADGEPKRKRRRGRRGGRRNRRSQNDGEKAAAEEGDTPSGKDDASSDGEDKPADKAVAAGAAEPAAEAEAKAETKADDTAEKKAEPESASGAPAAETAPAPEAPADKDAAKEDLEELAKAVGEPDAQPQPDMSEKAAEAKKDEPQTEPDDPQEPRRVGWWQRAFQKN